MFLDYNETIVINGLPYGNVYSDFVVRVYDQKSFLLSEEGVSTEIIDTSISRMKNVKFVAILFRFFY